MPTVSANRNASCLYSSVYLRFGTVSLAIAFSVHQNIIKILLYVETGQGHFTPGKVDKRQEQIEESIPVVEIQSVCASAQTGRQAPPYSRVNCSR